MAKQYEIMPLKIAAIYASIGCLWILFSDRAVAMFVTDPAMVTIISIAKGWIYVLLTAMLLYWLIRRHLAVDRCAEDKLKASEEKFSRAFNFSPVLMAITTIDDGSYIDVNEQFCRVTGFSRQEVIGRTSVELGCFSAAGRERMITVMRRDGRVADIEIELTAKDGRSVSCSFSAEIVTIEGVQRLLSIALDITERKKSLAALNYVNECFSQALNGSQHVLYRLNVKNGCYDYLSPTFEQITGYRVDGFKNNSLEKVKEFFHPEDRSRIFALIETLSRSRTDNTADLDLEYRFRKADGSYCWLHDSTTACFNDNGELECFFGSAHDITDRKKAEKGLKESEERYRRFSSITSDYVTSCRRSGSDPFRVEWMAGAVEAITGYPQEQFFDWGCWMPIVHQEDVSRVKGHLLEVKAGETSTNEFRIVRKDGEIRWIHEVCRCEAGDFPGELLLYGTSQDITKRKAAEAAILNLNEHLEHLVQERTAELERSNEELATFCYAVSHELRAPIARLQGFSGILGEVCHEGGEASFLAARIANASGQLQSVVDAILQLSRLSRMDLSLQQLDLGEMAKRKMDLLLAEHPDRRVELVIGPSLMAVADPNLMDICLDNLVNNAFKYTGQTPAARIEIGAYTDSGKEVYFVRDNGAGFDMAYAAKLYLPFQRLHQQEDFPGFGVGLATVKRIIERHGGEIWAEAAIGSGAAFYFTLGCTK